MVSKSAERDQVGPFELRLLAAINTLRSEAWGSKLQSVMSEGRGRDVAVGQLYLALARLESRGFISFTNTIPEPRKGGRSKKVFRLEAPGLRALESTAALMSGVLRYEENYDGREIST